METDFETETKTRTDGLEKHKEGPLARKIEEQTAKLPSDAFLWTSIGAMAISLSLKLAGKNQMALFVGQWAAPFLLFGVYNKLVKIGGHDKTELAYGE